MASNVVGTCTRFIPRWYVAAYQIILNELIGLAVASYWFMPWRIIPTIKAVNQALLLDMELAVSS